ALPFTYSYYGQPFNNVNVSASGNLQFTSNVVNDIIHSCLPISNFNNTIFAYWEQLYTGCPGCGVYTSTSGTAPNRLYNIEWRAGEPGGFYNANFEVRLYEDGGRFDMVYGMVGTNGRAATIGAQRDTGSHFTQYICYPFEDVVNQGLMLIYEQPLCTPRTATPTITPGGPTLTPTATAIATACPVMTDYTITQSTGAEIVPGTVDIGVRCDDCSTVITLPFAFRLYGTYEDRVGVDSNGIMESYRTFGRPNNSCLPTSGYCQVFFPHWDDLRTDGTGTGIFTSTTGTAPNRIFNIEWRACLNLDAPCSAATVNFEIRLYEGQSKFEYIYGAVEGNGAGATIGVGGCYGTPYTQFSCDTGTLYQGLKLTFAQTCATSATPTATGTPPTRTPTRTGTPATFTPIPTPTGDDPSYSFVDGRVPAEWPENTPFELGLFVHSGAHRVLSAQNYLTFTSSILQVVSPGSTSCTPASTLLPDLAVFDALLQNEVCNGPALCSFRGNSVGPGSIAFASGALNNPAADGDFRVATLTFCATGQGTAVLHWQFSPPAPPNRNSAVIDDASQIASDANPALYTDFVIQLGPTSTPTSTPRITPPASGTVVRTNTPRPGGTGVPTSTGTPPSFTDVHADDYFDEAVTYLASRGVISGYLDGTFRPYNLTTRGQLAKIAVLAEGWPLYAPTSPTFRDVAAGSTFYPYIETAYRRGIISGYACGSGCLEYRPDNNITRGQLCKIIVNARGWQSQSPANPTFRDVAPTHTFYAAIETAYAQGIISGYGCGTGCLEFRPGNNATRGQIAKIVYLAIIR
ncbi:MAG: S-layer homology domain-containing protein, partial [Chloroflexia bacterium]